MSVFPLETMDVDVCVVGGGMSGLCAALAAARHGARTVLVHDRPVLGGNASSEVRMWICGAHGPHNKETGLVEEIQLEHCYRNPAGVWSIWDSILYGKAAFQPGLTLLLNTSCTGALADRGRVEYVEAWQLSSQTRYRIHAKQFIDCSGDSILAPAVGAEFRVGRESRDEFGEDIQPAQADRKTMGNSLLIQLRKTDEPQPFIPPRWAYKFTSPSDLPYRMNGVNGHNFWWIELGGLDDTIGDAERIRHELYRVAFGVWDYIKNYSPAKAEAESWALEWLGSVPGKRENRRYVGHHVLTQNDIRAEGKFADTVAYGGWTMDDHHPAGLLYPGKPTVFHPAPATYGIPLRCLYSRNIANLFFAGRNISVTHAALSSTRVMATCTLLGQAAGTAAAVCIQHRCDPATLVPNHTAEVQRLVMGDDCWLPGLRRPIAPLTQAATLGGDGSGVERLIDGLDRDRENEPHAWETSAGGAVTFAWSEAVDVRGVRLVCDSDLRDVKRMPCSYPLKGNRCTVPRSLLKRYRIEARRADGSWETVFREEANYQRLVYAPLQAHTTALRLVAEETWGGGDVRLFAAEADTVFRGNIPPEQDGPPWRDVVAKANPADLAPPEHGLGGLTDEQLLKKPSRRASA
jgi:hypothetical protein